MTASSGVTLFWSIFCALGIFTFSGYFGTCLQDPQKYTTRALAALYDLENYTYCQDEPNSAEHFFADALKAWLLCSSWTHHKNCFRQCAAKAAGLTKDDGHMNKTTVRRWMAAFPKQYRKQIYKAAVKCYEGKIPPVDGQCMEARRRIWCFDKNYREICTNPKNKLPKPKDSDEDENSGPPNPISALSSMGTGK